VNKELAKPTKDKIVFKKFPDTSKKIKNTTHSPTTYHQSVISKYYINNDLISMEDRRPAYNSVLPLQELNQRFPIHRVRK